MKQALSLIAKIHEKGNRYILEELNKNGITELAPSHGDILAMLYKYEKLTMKDLAEKIHRTKPTVTVLVNKLEKLSYVKREKSSEDSRITYIKLTSKGEEFRSIFEKISEDLNKMLYKNLSEDDANILDSLLSKMEKNIFCQNS